MAGQLTTNTTALLLLTPARYSMLLLLQGPLPHPDTVVLVLLLLVHFSSITADCGGSRASSRSAAV